MLSANHGFNCCKNSILLLLITFETSHSQCTGGYVPVSGDIFGWGSVNGVGGGVIVQSCSQCTSLCNQQAKCLSTECSPTSLQCNLNDRADVDTVIGYRDFRFCQKPTGNNEFLEFLSLKLEYIVISQQKNQPSL